MVKRGAGHPTVPGHMPPVLGGEAQLRGVLKLALKRASNEPERDTVVDRALEKAGKRTVPVSAGALAAFVFGPFRETVVERLGSDVAATVTSSLLPMLTNHAARDPIVEEAHEAGSQVGTEAEIPTVETPTLVLADADAASRKQTTAMLRSIGHHVVPVPDGHVALAVCIRRRPALVIAAAGPPAVDPHELALLLQVAFATEAPQVIAVADDDFDPAEFGVAAVLRRPLDERELRDLVDSLLEG